LTRQRLATSLRLTCRQVRLICSEGHQWRFEGFVSPRNCLLIIFDRYQAPKTGAQLAATASVVNKSQLLAQSIHSNPDCLGDYELAIYSILSLSCFMCCGALDNSALLLSYSKWTLARYFSSYYNSQAPVRPKDSR